MKNSPIKNWLLKTEATNPKRQTTNTHATEQGRNLHECGVRFPFDNLEGLFKLLLRRSFLTPSYILECPIEGLWLPKTSWSPLDDTGIPTCKVPLACRWRAISECKRICSSYHPNQTIGNLKPHSLDPLTSLSCRIFHGRHDWHPCQGTRTINHEIIYTIKQCGTYCIEVNLSKDLPRV